MFPNSLGYLPINLGDGLPGWCGDNMFGMRTAPNGMYSTTLMNLRISIVLPLLLVSLTNDVGVIFILLITKPLPHLTHLLGIVVII